MIHMVLYVDKSPTCTIHNFRPIYICFGTTASIPAMQKIYFNKRKSVLWKNDNLPLVPCTSPLHSKIEIMESFRMYGHITPNVNSCLETGGGSTYPLAHFTPLSPNPKYSSRRPALFSEKVQTCFTANLTSWKADAKQVIYFALAMLT